MNFDVLYTSNFEREFKQLYKKHKSLKRDLEILISDLESNPNQGTSLGKSCYKIRLSIASKGKGKSGGARVITHIFVKNKIVYLLSIFDKSNKDNITDKEILALLEQLIDN